jgi:hypothetical protein
VSDDGALKAAIMAEAMFVLDGAARLLSGKSRKRLVEEASRRLIEMRRGLFRKWPSPMEIVAKQRASDPLSLELAQRLFEVVRAEVSDPIVAYRECARLIESKLKEGPA